MIQGIVFVLVAAFCFAIAVAIVKFGSRWAPERSTRGGLAGIYTSLLWGLYFAALYASVALLVVTGVLLITRIFSPR